MNDQAWANAVVDQCMARGVDHFFVAPGSRCTPLTLAIARHAKARITQHFDERGLAFAALGFGKATRRAGVFVCTSGTAVANAFPAVVEAATECIPMLLFTADRPDELRGTGANQTIEQREIFGSYPRRFINMPVPEDLASGEDSYLDEQLANCVVESANGPVHVNWMFREPFTIEENDSFLEIKITNPVEYHPDQPDTLPVKVEGNTLVVVGNCMPDEAREALALANRLCCPLLTDITSGLRKGSLELPSEFSLPKPDTILHIGGRVVSKSWLQWTGSLQESNTKFIHLTPSGQTFNPNRLSQTKIQTPIMNLNSKVEGDLTSEDFRNAWQDAAHRRSLTIKRELVETQELTEPAIAYHLLQETPPTHGLFVGNSMPIRDMDWYSANEDHANIVDDIRWIDANRGASGIDGLMATASGFASGLQRPVSIVLGDLSALHDLNSLALIANSPWPVFVIIINNQGGHIFDLLPIRKSQHFEQYFATPHSYQFEHAAKMFGLPYHRCCTMGEFVEGYRKSSASQHSVVLELVTDRKKNMETRQRLKEEILKCSLS